MTDKTPEEVIALAKQCGAQRAEGWHKWTFTYEQLQAFIAALTATQPVQPAESTVCEVSHKQMFEAACVDLGLINEALGIDPDGGGAKPIIEAINTLKKRAEQGERLAIAVMSDNGNMFVG